MITSFFITVNRKGTCKLTSKAPALKPGEVSVKMSLQLPNSEFDRPQIQATIVIPEDAVMPAQIDAKTSQNVKDAIIQATGLDVKLTVVNPE